MTLRDVNPFTLNSVSVRSNRQAHEVQRWPWIVAWCASGDFAVSTLTLPFANVIWHGELPPLALIQLPKSLLKSAVHETLMFAIESLGMSRGSFSPDYIAGSQRVHRNAVRVLPEVDVTSRHPVTLVVRLPGAQHCGTPG